MSPPQSKAYSDFNAQLHLPWKMLQLSMEFKMSTAIYPHFSVRSCCLRPEHVLPTDDWVVNL